jgi:hypothetical protein
MNDYEKAKHDLEIMHRYEISPSLRKTYQIAKDAIDKTFIGKSPIVIRSRKCCLCRMRLDDAWRYCPMCGQKVRRSK